MPSQAPRLVISTTLDSQTVHDLDRAAKLAHVTRSEIVRQAIEEFMHRIPTAEWEQTLLDTDKA